MSSGVLPSVLLKYRRKALSCVPHFCRGWKSCPSVPTSREAGRTEHSKPDISDSARLNHKLYAQGVLALCLGELQNPDFSFLGRSIRQEPPKRFRPGCSRCSDIYPFRRLENQISSTGPSSKCTSEVQTLPTTEVARIDSFGS